MERLSESADTERAIDEVIDAAFDELPAATSTKQAALWDKSRASHYRRLAPPMAGPSRPARPRAR